MSDNRLAATLALPKQVHIHPAVHVSRLKAYKGETSADGDPTPEAAAKDFGVEPEQAEAENRAGTDPQIETILGWRNVESTRPPHQVLRQEFLVKWTGREDADNTWLSRTALGDHRHQAENFMEAGYLDDEPAVRKRR